MGCLVSLLVVGRGCSFLTPLLPPARELRTLQQEISHTTKLFLLNFSNNTVHGVYKASQPPGLDLVPGAFGGRFGAQVKWTREGPSGLMLLGTMAGKHVSFSLQKGPLLPVTVVGLSGVLSAPRAPLSPTQHQCDELERLLLDNVTKGPTAAGPGTSAVAAVSPAASPRQGAGSSSTGASGGGQGTSDDSTERAQGDKKSLLDRLEVLVGRVKALPEEEQEEVVRRLEEVVGGRGGGS